MTLLIEPAFDVDVFVASYGALTIHVVETGGATFDITPFTSGRYFIAISGAGAVGPHDDEVTSISSFLTALQTELNAHAGGGSTYSVGFAGGGTNHVEIVNSGGAVTNIAWTFSAGFQKLLSLATLTPTGRTVTASNTPYYLLVGDNGFWSPSSDFEGEAGDVAEDVLAHDGTPGGLSRLQADRKYNVTIPLEPRAKIWTQASGSASYPYHWEEFFRDVRNEMPIAMDDSFDGSGTTFIQLRADGAKLEPQRVGGPGYIATFDIPIRARPLAWST